MPNALERNLYLTKSIVFQINSDNMSLFTQNSVRRKHIHFLCKNLFMRLAGAQWTSAVYSGCVQCMRYLVTVYAFGGLLQKFNPIS
jgi:hypothetical protein